MRRKPWEKRQLAIIAPIFLVALVATAAADQGQPIASFGAGSFEVDPEGTYPSNYSQTTNGISFMSINSGDTLTGTFAEANLGVAPPASLGLNLRFLTGTEELHFTLEIYDALKRSVAKYQGVATPSGTSLFLARAEQSERGPGDASRVFAVQVTWEQRPLFPITVEVSSLAKVQMLAPVIQSGLSALANVGQSFSYQISATNSPDSFAVSGLPAGLTFSSSTGLIGGTPTSSGTYKVTISATNEGGTDAKVLRLVVSASQGGGGGGDGGEGGGQADPPPPSVSSPLTAFGRVGELFGYRIEASNSPSSYGAVGLPDGLSVDAATGEISGSPLEDGVFEVDLFAANASGEGEARLILTVRAAGAPGPGLPGTVSFSESMAQKVVAFPADGEVFYEVLSTGRFTCRGKVPWVSSEELEEQTPLVITVGGWVYEGELGDDPRFVAGKSKSVRFRLPTGASVSVALGKTAMTWSVTAKTGSVAKKGEVAELELSPLAESLFADESYQIGVSSQEKVEVSVVLGEGSTSGEVAVEGKAQFRVRKVGSGDLAEEYGLNSVKVKGAGSTTPWE